MEDGGKARESPANQEVSMIIKDASSTCTLAIGYLAVPLRPHLQELGGGDWTWRLSLFSRLLAYKVSRIRANVGKMLFLFIYVLSKSTICILNRSSHFMIVIYYNIYSHTHSLSLFVWKSHSYAEND